MIEIDNNHLMIVNDRDSLSKIDLIGQHYQRVVVIGEFNSHARYLIRLAVNNGLELSCPIMELWQADNYPIYKSLIDYINQGKVYHPPTSIATLVEPMESVHVKTLIAICGHSPLYQDLLLAIKGTVLYYEGINDDIHSLPIITVSQPLRILNHIHQDWLRRLNSWEPFYRVYDYRKALYRKVIDQLYSSRNLGLEPSVVVNQIQVTDNARKALIHRYITSVIELQYQSYPNVAYLNIRTESLQNDSINQHHCIPQPMEIIAEVIEMIPESEIVIVRVENPEIYQVSDIPPGPLYWIYGQITRIPHGYGSGIFPIGVDRIIVTEDQYYRWFHQSIPICLSQGNQPNPLPYLIKIIDFDPSGIIPRKIEDRERVVWFTPPQDQSIKEFESSLKDYLGGFKSK